MVSCQNGSWLWLLRPSWEAAWPAQPAARAAPAGSGHRKLAWALQWDAARPCQLLKGKERHGGQLWPDQGEGKPFSWLVDQALLWEFMSGHLAPWIRPWSTRLSSWWATSHLPWLPPDGQWIMWWLGAMDTASPHQAVWTPFSREGKGLCSGRFWGNHFKGFLSCDSLIV